jgi:hypothetical protein
VISDREAVISLASPFVFRVTSRDKLHNIAPDTSLEVSMQTPESRLEALAKHVGKLKHALLAHRIWEVCRGAVLALPLLCAVLGSAIPFFSQTPLEPVPSKWLREGKLVAEDFNFSIASPNPDAQWTYKQDTASNGVKRTTFFVQDSTDARFAVIVVDSEDHFDSGNTKKFVDGMQRTMPKDWRIEDTKIEPSSFPWKGSSKVKVTLRLPNQAALYMYGYVVTSNRNYFMLDYSPETAEPPQFSHFVSSFAYLSPPSPRAPNSSPVPGVLLILAVWGAIADWRYKRNGGTPPSKRDKIIFFSTVGAAVMILVVLGTLGSSEEALGRLTVGLAAILFAAWEFGRWRMRRKYLLPQKTQMANLPVASTSTIHPKTQGSLTKSDLMALHKAGFGTEILIAKIKATPCSFETSPSALKELKDAGIPDSVIFAMVQVPRND